MARHESDRDDLFAELAALNPRVELRIDRTGQTVCAGRRESTGGWSVYLTPDRVYHFDREGRLRRAYVEGFLYRSEGETLSRLKRERSAAETTLRRHDLDAEELTAFLDVMRSRIVELLKQIHSGQVQVLRTSEAAKTAVDELMVALEVAMECEPPLAPALRR